MGRSEDMRLYQLLRSNQACIVASTQVNADFNYLEVMNHWDGEQIAQNEFDSVKEITFSQRRNVQGRLLIRLAILQAFADLGKSSLTLRDMDSYWSVRAREKLHTKARGLHRKSGKMLYEDIAAMAGLSVSKVPPHPNPPIKIVDANATVSTANSPTNSSPISLSNEDRTELRRLEADLNDIDRPVERDAVVKVRLLQGVFRERVLLRWGACAVTGVENPLLLVASHVKPWRACNDLEKLDPDNGLLLSPTFDSLFDQGLMTFDDNGYAAFSDSLNSDDLARLQVPSNISLRKTMTGEMKAYMDFHREHIFKG